MDEKSTSNLMNVLKNTDKNGIEKFKSEYLMNQPFDFASYISDIIDEKKLKRQDIFQKADLIKGYGYKLLNGESRTSDRDKLLRIFIAMNMNIKETQRALELYGLPPLYPKKSRDMVIIVAINNGISNVDTVNEMLLKQGECELNRSPD